MCGGMAKLKAVLSGREIQQLETAKAACEAIERQAGLAEKAATAVNAAKWAEWARTACLA